MKLLALQFLFLPAFLFAQESAEFVVKKKALKLYYSKDNTEDTAYTNYLWVSNNRVCFYASPETPESEYNQSAPLEWIFSDSLTCHDYVSYNDTLKFVETGGNTAPGIGSYTYVTYYTLYPSGSKHIFHTTVLFSNNTSAHLRYTFSEFVLPKKE